jgi:hypothetical protein
MEYTVATCHRNLKCPWHRIVHCMKIVYCMQIVYCILYANCIPYAISTTNIFIALSRETGIVLIVNIDKEDAHKVSLKYYPNCQLRITIWKHR